MSINVSSKTIISPAFSSDNIPIVFAANDGFCPYLSVMIQSILEHASSKRNYDILILHRDISEWNESKFYAMIETHPNISIRLLNVSELIAGYSFYTQNRTDFTIDAYFRLMIPYILSDEYTKAIYLDGDMVVTTDVAELYETDVSGYLLASSRDMCGIAAYYDPKDSRKKYREEVLKITNPDDYFISGMLVMNLEKFRKQYTLDFILKFATAKNWMQHDQDVLNILCNDGKAKMLHASWDVLELYKPEVLPVELYQELIESITEPKIIHYGGTNKPWKTANTHHVDLFWKTAAQTPFYEEIIERLLQEKTNAKSGLSFTNEDMVQRFRSGDVGFRYIIKFAIAWLKYKIRK